EAFVRASGLDNPIGAHIRSGPQKAWLEIEGVVADSKYGLFGETFQPIVYLPYLQAGGRLFIVAPHLGPGGAFPEIQRAILEIDKTAILDVRSMRDATSLEFSLRRMGTWILGILGLLGLALAMVGLYGVMSYIVNHRMPEIGIRVALGAPAPAILWMI